MWVVEACGAGFYRGGAFGGQMGGTIRVMGAFCRWMRDVWQRMEEVRVRGSVTWLEGDLGVCFFCEDVAGSTDFGGNRG